jgi:opacity protein-like surface antigen
LTEPYYAIKYYRFLDALPNLGLGIDFTHFKVFITDFNQSIHRTGTKDGVEIDDYIRAGDYFKYYSISHGINHIAFSAIYRLMFLKTDKIPDGIVQPYAGIGFGPSIPHGELKVINDDGTTTQKVYSYRLGFPNFGFDLCLGVMIKPDPHISFNFVYKYTYSMLGDISFDNGEDGHIETFFEANHFQWGMSFIF